MSRHLVNTWETVMLVLILIYVTKITTYVWSKNDIKNTIQKVYKICSKSLDYPCRKDDTRVIGLMPSQGKLSQAILTNKNWLKPSQKPVNQYQNPQNKFNAQTKTPIKGNCRKHPPPRSGKGASCCFANFAYCHHFCGRSQSFPSPPNRGVFIYARTRA
jgi:hypothetical protein